MDAKDRTNRSASADALVDRICDQFESAWKAGQSPKLADYLSQSDERSRASLFHALLSVEVELLRNRGDEPSRATYQKRFPEFAEQIDDVFRSRPPKPNGREAEANGSASHEAVTQVLTSDDNHSHITIDHASPPRPSRGSRSSSGSRGLHIRCPHCSNPVELLTDTSFESITCETCGSAFSLVDNEEQTREAPTLKVIGRFELVSRLGMGGFGTVWKARDTELDRTVAIKIPRKGQLNRDEVEQFFREARSAAQLRHPNIVPVHEVGRDADTIFIVSDLIRGVSLSDWLSGGRPNFYECAQLMATICDALQHAHDKGVIHRDLKPSNILLDDAGQPYVMDFGLAKREVGEITMTVEGNILGTPAYMSPEQAAGEGHSTDRRSDIYSLGVILFRMLTGELPFRGNAQMQIHQRLNEDPPDPRKLNRYLPRDLCTVCLKCLERDPNRRFNTAKELGDEFRRYFRREPIVSRPISRTERTIRWCRRNPALAAAIALTTILAIAGPAAAIAFRRMNTNLQARIVENDNLIGRYRRDSQKSASQIENLRSQLDVWEGRANPWTFWPPKRDTSPRRNLVANVLEHSTATLGKSLADKKFQDEDAARGYYSLAVLNDVAGKSADARKYYQQARSELTSLRAKNSDQPQIARALAECEMRLARLSHDTDPESAEKSLENARAIYRQLATIHRADPTFQIDWLESELKSSIGAKPESRDEHLNRVQEINRALEGNWPSDPNTIYRLACYLAEEPAILLPKSGAAGPAGAVGAKANSKTTVE